ncbi:PTS mannose transporter subunit IIA [Advenella faeciporci]|uniref:PTS mannose transporter subunit IIA n=1 Tax=Advenella faeciporci TaxID=797535 RepID=A0A918JH69_9BURK|nr:PTS sugar transporter subunit IIA [Advenella faeciporci]GGW75873.1 PTS mannose transporter subunit IIA [Advenella faeciporci]
MTAIAIIAHVPLASALHDCATHVYGNLENFVFFDIEPDVDPEQKVAEITGQLRSLADKNNAVLVLADLGGATPANIGARAVQILQKSGIQAHILSGTNACMILNAIRYRDKPLEELCESVFEGGKKGMKCIDLAKDQ